MISSWGQRPNHIPGLDEPFVAVAEVQSIGMAADGTPIFNDTVTVPVRDGGTIDLSALPPGCRYVRITLSVLFDRAIDEKANHL